MQHKKIFYAKYNFRFLSIRENFVLLPGRLLFYSWDNPIGNREITWTCGNIKNEVIKNDKFVSYRTSHFKTFVLMNFVIF